MFEAVGLPKAQMVKTYDIIGIPIVDTSAKFFIPSRFGDRVVIETYVKEWRRSSFSVSHTLLRGNELAIQAQEIRVWAGKDPERPEGIRARAIPAEVADKFTMPTP